MIKINKVIMLLLCSSFLLVGCKATNSNPQPDSIQQPSNPQGQGIIGFDTEGQPGLFGRVKSIIGNEVVLEVATIPEGNMDRSEGRQNRSTTGTPANQGGFQGGPGQMQLSGPGQGQGGLSFTGETVTFFIPVGIPIMSSSLDAMKEMDIGDIYAGASLRIWYDDEEKINISQIMVMSGR